MRLLTTLLVTVCLTIVVPTQILAQCKANENHLADVDFPTPIGQITLTICFNEEKRTLIKRGSINGVPVDTQESSVRHLYDRVFLYSERQVFRIGGEKMAGWSMDYAIDIRKPHINGYNIEVATRKGIHNKLSWKSVKKENWPQALKGSHEDRFDLIPLTREQLKRKVESLSESDLKVALETTDRDTLVTALDMVDLATLKAAVAVIDDATLKLGLEGVEDARLKYALIHTSAKNLIRSLEVVNAETLVRGIEALDEDTLRIAINGNRDTRPIDKATLKYAVIGVDRDTLLYVLKVASKERLREIVQVMDQPTFEVSLEVASPERRELMNEYRK